MPFGPRGLYRLIPHLTWQAREQVSRVLRLVPSGARIVDLGAGGRRISPGTIAVDFVPDPNTNVVGDVQRLPFADGTVDLVYATGLLEHVADERAVVAEIRRILKPGGLAHLEVPFLEQYHEDPIDCRRLTAPGLERLMREAGFETVASGAHIGPTVTMLNTVARWWALWLEGDSRVMKALSFALFTFLSIVYWPFKFLDAFLIGKRGAHTLALGVYFTGRKR
ncbi:MAG: class I SAM-dependent methyltransferase [Planctomycetes bacterium]|nr:class I SAM-dependent methyltransferase [Planctomycetota bacterium]